MIGTYITALLVVALSLVVGRAVMSATGRRRWTGIEPAVGFAAVMAVQGLLARLPGNREGLLLGLAALVLLSLYALRRAGLRDIPKSPFFWAAAVVTLCLTSIPFLITERWGLLGMGYNNDLGLHLAWAEYLRSGFGVEPSDGYPLGPHGLSASLSYLPGLNLGPAFIGQVMAIATLTVMTAWAAVERLGPWRRLLAAVLVGLPYLMASYFAQGAFKELAAAMFLLAFTIALPTISPLPSGRRQRFMAIAPLLVLLLGIVFTYSFPGLAFPLAVTVVWLLANPDFRAWLRASSLWRELKRPFVAVGAIVSLGLLSALAFWGPFGFGDVFSEVATSDAFGPVSAIEAFGVWLTPDYRLDGEMSTPLPGLMAAIAILATLIALLWWRRQPRSIYPFAFFACAIFYLLSVPWVGDYSLAKALVISSPIVMVVILTALLSGPGEGGRAKRGIDRAAWVSFTTVFIGLAIASSLLVLRDASVSPPGHAVELSSFAEEVAGKTVIYGDQDRFAPYYLPEAEVSVPLEIFPDPDVVANPKKPFQGDFGQSAIDFDSFDADTLGRHDYVITTGAAWTSVNPPFYTLVDETDSFKLWRRDGPAFGRPIMRENAMPAKLADCNGESGRYFSQIDGTAVLMPESVVGRADEWIPGPELRAGESASILLDLEPGEWRLSLQYFTPNGMRLIGPGYARTFPAAIDGQRISNQRTGSFGQFWPGGLFEVEQAGPVEFTATADDPSFLQELTGYSRETKLGRIVATRTGARQRVPMAEICDRWVDFFRLAQSTPRDDSTEQGANRSD